MSKLLEQAIADAKAVKAVAYANAKAALEEAFRGPVEAMLAEKLKEEALADEAVMAPAEAGTAMSGPSHSELHSAGHEDKTPEQPVEMWTEESDEMGEETVTNEELEEILAELSHELEENDGAPAPAPADPAAQAPVAPVAPVPDAVPAPAPAPVAPPAPAPVAPPPAPAPEAPAPVAEADLEEIDLNELLSSLNESAEEEEEACEESVTENAEEEGEAAHEEEEEAVSKECYESVVRERDDAIAAISHYKKQLSEVNLLNAKLLYTNKLFKAHPLTNEQKMRVVETFDLTQTVREVKIAYTSLAESFNFGKSTVKKNTAAQTITEGLASKTVASTKPAPAVIVENISAQALRFQTLAGIKKA